MALEKVDSINAPHIDKELEKLRIPQRGLNTRAGLFNLIVYCSEPKRHEFLQKIADAIVGRFPSRILFIQKSDATVDDVLSATVTHATVTKNGESIDCDYVLIDVSENQLTRIPLLLLSCLIPDIPLYLLWGQNPIKERVILPHLIPYATRLIFDSDCMEKLSTFSSEIIKLIDSNQDIDVIDLNWVRIHGWRNILKRVFDNAEYHKLKSSQGIQIFYNSKAASFVLHPEIQAVYLASWLITRMDWKLISYARTNGCLKALCNNGENDFEINLIPQPHEDMNEGAIISIEITCCKDQVISILPHDTLTKATVYTSNPEMCQLPFCLPLPGLKKGSFSTTELIFSRTSSHYRNMLQLIQNRENEGLIK